MRTFKLIFKAFVYLFCFFWIETGCAQNVGISTTSGFTPDASAGLDISYTSKGLLIPRVALTATNAAGPIASPATSLLVYNTATAGTSPNNVVPGYYYWNGLSWVLMVTSAQTTNLAWSLTGNAGTTAGTNFIGTTDAADFVFKTNNAEKMRIAGGSGVSIGGTAFNSTNPEQLLVDAGTTSSFNVISGKGNLNNYLQLNIQNNNAGTTASSDIVATADNGSETANFVDMGINSSANTSAYFGAANDAYLYNAGGTVGGNFFIGTSTAGKSLGFLTGGGATTNERMRIDGNGNVGIGNTVPSQKLDITGNLRFSGALMPNNNAGTAGYFLISAGAGVAPTWFNANTYAWLTTGNAGTTAGTNFIGNTDAVDFVTKTNNTERVRVTSAGNVGIGIATPSTKLHVFGANPLTLSGVVTGTSTTADSLLTITSGLVRKLPLSTFALPTNSWATTGNTGTTAGTNFLGTTDANDLVFKANNVERMRIVNGTSSTTGTTGDITVGDANSGTLRSAKELVLRQDGDTYGPSTLRLRNRNGQNGAVFETTGGTANLVDFIFNTGPVATPISSNIRFETRSGSMKVSGNTTEWQIGQPDVVNGGPTLIVGASGTGSNSSFLTGNVGIGTTTPTEKLDLAGNLKFSGALMPNNNAGTSGYILQSAGAGSPPTWVSSSASQAWGLTGNTGTTAGTNFIGTTDAVDFAVKTNGTERMRVSSTGDVSIGGTAFNGTNPEQLLVDAGSTSTTPTTSFNVISGRGYIDKYLQLNIQNMAPTASASSDVVASNDAATESINYVDLGINSSGNTSTGVLGGASTGYLLSTGNDFAIGNGTANKGLLFFTTNATASNENMRVDGATGNVGVGTTNPTARLHINGGTNPLKINNVATGTVTDSLVTITTGLIRKVPASTYVNTTATQTVAGAKTFSAATTFSSTAAFSSTTTFSGAATFSAAPTFSAGATFSGAVAYPILVAPASGTLTLGTTHYTVIIPSNSTYAVTLPTASSSAKRVYVIINQTTAAITVGSYISFTGSAVTTIPGQTSVCVQSDGINWYRIQ